MADTYQEAMERVAKTAKYPRITKEVIEGRIKDTRYLMDGPMTVCIIELHNGFKVVGVSSPADERNFDPEAGKTFARENAFRQLWPHFGFMLREQIALRENTGIHIEYLGLEGVPSQPDLYDPDGDPIERELRKER